MAIVHSRPLNNGFHRKCVRKQQQPPHWFILAKQCLVRFQWQLWWHFPQFLAEFLWKCHWTWNRNHRPADEYGLKWHYILSWLFCTFRNNPSRFELSNSLATFSCKTAFDSRADSWKVITMVDGVGTFALIRRCQKVIIFFLLTFSNNLFIVLFRKQLAQYWRLLPNNLDFPITFSATAKT